MRTRIIFVGALCLAFVLPASVLGSGPAATGAGQSSRVYMQETPIGQVCIATGPSSGYGYPLTLTLSRSAHLALLFTGEFGGLQANEEGMLLFSLDGGSMMSPQWSFTAPSEITRTAATISWTFFNVPKGTHTVRVDAQVAGGNLSGQLDRCSLTATVIDPNLAGPIASAGTTTTTRHVDGSLVVSSPGGYRFIARFEVRTTPSGEVQFGYMELYGINDAVGGKIIQFTINHVDYYMTASGAMGARFSDSQECRMTPWEPCFPSGYYMTDGSAVGQADTFLGDWAIQQGDISIYTTTTQKTP